MTMDNTPPSPEDLNCQSRQEEIKGDLDLCEVEVRDLILTVGISDHEGSLCNRIAFGGIVRPILIIEGGVSRRARQSDMTCTDHRPLQPITDLGSLPDSV